MIKCITQLSAAVLVLFVLLAGGIVCTAQEDQRPKTDVELPKIVVPLLFPGLAKGMDIFLEQLEAPERQALAANIALRSFLVEELRAGSVKREYLPYSKEVVHPPQRL